MGRGVDRDSTSIKKGASREAPSDPSRAASRRSRDLAPGSTLNLARIQASRTDADLRRLPVDENPGHLEIGLPDAANLVVRVRDVVAERNAFPAHVASSFRHDQPSMSSMRAMSAPSPLRCPVLRIRVYPPARDLNLGPTSWNSLSAVSRLWMWRTASRRSCSVPDFALVMRRSTNGRSS